MICGANALPDRGAQRMNKKLNTVLFLLGATVINIIIMIALFLLGMFLFGRFLPGFASSGRAPLMMVLLFAVTLGGTYGIYHSLIRLLARFVDLDRYFQPILGNKRNKSADQ